MNMDLQLSNQSKTKEKLRKTIETSSSQWYLIPTDEVHSKQLYWINEHGFTVELTTQCTLDENIQRKWCEQYHK